MTVNSQETLQHARCASPGCTAHHDPTTALVLACKKHGSRNARVSYAAGILFVKCSLCQKEMGSFHVAEKAP